jgi:hypothetical protein
MKAWAIIAADVVMVAAAIAALLHDYAAAYLGETLVVLLVMEHFYIGPSRARR